MAPLSDFDFGLRRAQSSRELSRAVRREDLRNRKNPPMSKTRRSLDRGRTTLIGNYARLPVVMDRGDGAYLLGHRRQALPRPVSPGSAGRSWVHAHPDLVAAVRAQAGRLWHVRHTFFTEPQIELAERLNRFRVPRQGVLLSQRRRGQRGRL